MPLTDARRALCVSLHDVAPATWPACVRILEALHAVAPVPVTLLVVPDYHRLGRVDRDPTFVRAIDARLAQGDEIALHGFYHVDDAPQARTPWGRLRRRFYTAGEGEFAALDAAQARERLEAGLALFQRLGWSAPGFVAPAWLLGDGAWQALSALSFQYTTTLQGLHHLPSRRFIPSQSLVYSVRSPWRVWLSRRWNPFLFQRLQDNSVLRLSLHPADAAHPQVMRDWQDFLARALADRVAMTKEAAVRACV